MKKNLTWLFCWLTVALLTASCSKDKAVVAPYGTKPITLGLYQYGTDSGKRVFMPITKVGNQTVSFYSVFDTGSSGMTLDAHDIVPASMITSSGFTFTGDSVVVNGITITSQQGVLNFGNKTGLTKEYGNVAYATITIGDQNGSTTAKRVPFFLYYKVIDGSTGKAVTVNHSLDIFGVGPGTSFASSLIPSPLTYFNVSNNLTNGFRLALLQSNQFSNTGSYVGGLLTIGLTASDLSSSGFVMHPLAMGSSGGYSPNIPAIITYNDQTIQAQVLFDSGTPLVSIIENKTAVALNSTGPLPDNTVVTLTTNMGFKYTYTTTSTANLTAVQNPNITGDLRTIFGIDFFVSNEYLTDYTNHRIGLKNN